jgi:hypothetical protein
VSEYFFQVLVSFSDIKQRIFHVASVSRPAVGPTQAPIKWVLGVKRCRDVKLTTHPDLMPRSRMSRSCICSPVTCMALAGKLYFTLMLWMRVFSEKLIVSQLVKTFPACYGTRRWYPERVFIFLSCFIKANFNIVLQPLPWFLSFKCFSPIIMGSVRHNPGSVISVMTV